MNLIVGDRTRWHLASVDGRNPIAVRAAVRELSIDDSPFTDFLERISDGIERRIQSRRERIRSSYRWWLDYRLGRAIYRAQKAGKWRLPRFSVHRVLRAFNAQIDRWMFAPEGNPALDRICWGVCVFALVLLAGDLVRAWLR